MDRMAPTQKTPDAAAPRTDRRHRIRHKLHSPIFASFRSSEPGVVIDLSELLDLTEDGFAVHTPEPLEANRPMALTLDLPETKTYIHDQGLVIWSDPSGHAGVRFPDLSDVNRRLLKQWLFANLLVASAHHAARTEQLSRIEEPAAEAPQPPPDAGGPAQAPDPTVMPSTVETHRDQSEPTASQDETVGDKPAPPEANGPEPDPVLATMLSAVEAVRQQVNAYADDPDAALHLVAACALGLTNASGAALALFTGGHMICRARSGDNAPPLGAPVDSKHGLSGECVRSGQVICSNDTENDARVDREICRALGIGSILAVPILADFRVVGLLEVFSPSPHAFTKTHETVLGRLAEIVPRTGPETPRKLKASVRAVLPALMETTPEADPSMHAVRDALWDQESEWKALGSATSARNLYLGLMALAVAVGALAAGYLLAPVIQRPWLRSSTPPVAAAAPQTNASGATATNSSEDLRNLAEAGDADAQYFLAVRYHTGTNVVQDDAQAVKWFERAANQGHVLAQADLPSYYWSGIGVPKDLSKAYFWAALAVAQGDENSKTTLEGLSTQMTRAQVDAARRQADNWLRKHNRAPRPASH
jgi:hypothetical protein